MCNYINAILLALMTLPGLLLAESPAFYVVDLQKVLNDSIAGKAARNTVKAEAQKREGKLMILSKELEAARDDIKKQASLLSAEAIEQKKQQLARKERDFELQVMEQREALRKLNDDQIGKVVSESELAVKKLAEKNNYNFVLVKDDGVVVYVSKDFDITESVIKSLDSKTLG